MNPGRAVINSRFVVSGGAPGHNGRGQPRPSVARRSSDVRVGLVCYLDHVAGEELTPHLAE